MNRVIALLKKTALIAISTIAINNTSFAQNNLDAEVMQLTSPLAPHTGTTRQIALRIRNVGNMAITSVKVGWKVNNGVETDVVLPVALPIPSNSNQMPTQVVTLTSSYVDAAGNSLLLYIKEVNNQTDVNQVNDTLKVTFGSPISGTKTIGNLPSDYKTFKEAINDIRYNGISGDITYKVKAGTYSEFIELVGTELNYTNGPKEIKFESQSGGRDVILVSEAAAQATIRLNGADRVSFNGFRIVNRNIVSGIGVHVFGQADRNTITNCDITVDSISNNKSFIGVLSASIGPAPAYVLGTAAAGRYLTISNNKISGGYYGIAASGPTSARDTGLVIDKNIINQVVYYGVYVLNNTNTKIRQNRVEFRPSADKKSTGYFAQTITTANPGNIEITRNYVYGAGQYGMYLSSVLGTTTRSVNIYNNMIAGGFFSNNSTAADLPAGLYMLNCGWANVYFNSILMDAPTNVGLVDNTKSFFVQGSTTFGQVRVYNNIFAHDNLGYAYYNNSAAASNPVVISDNNNLWVRNYDPANNPTTGFSYWNGGIRLTMADLRLASGKDANSISVDPVFFSKSDLHTLSNDLDQKGNTAALTEVPIDFDGELRDITNPPDIGCDEFGPGGEDFAIVGVTPDVFRYNNPTPWRIKVRYQGNSNGNKTLYFLYKINGVDQLVEDSAIVWSFTRLSNYFNTEDVIVPANRHILRTTYQSFKLTVYIYSGNIGDSRTLNDSLTVDVCVGLDGVFTIDKNQPPSNTNFTSFQEIYDYLKCGVAGPTTFEIADGVYDEQINLWKIRNSSAINRITFKSKNNVFSTRLTYVNGTTENHATVLFNNAQYITLKDLTIENRSISNGSCIQFAGNSVNNIITGCIIRLDSTITPFPNTLVPIVSSRLGTLNTFTAANAVYATNAQNNYIHKNKILGGYYGILMYGLDTTLRDKGNIIENNTITSFHKAGIYLDFADTKVLHNIIQGKLGMDLQGQGIYLKGLGDREGNDANLIQGNRIFDVTWNGIFLQNCLGKKAPGQKKSSFVVSNNMIGGGFTTSQVTTSGINFNTCQGITVAHNTIMMDAPRSSSNVVTDAFVARGMIVNNTNHLIEAINNIFYSTNGSIALEYYSRIRNQGAFQTGLSASDNNLFYTSFSNRNTPLILIQRRSNLNVALKNYQFSQLSQSPLNAMTEFKNDNNNSSRERKSIALPVKFESLPYDLHSYDLTIESKGAGGQDILTDYDREPRKGKNTDIGADEFTVPDFDLDINQILNPLLCYTKPNKIVIRLRNRGKFSLEGKRVALQYTMKDAEGPVVCLKTDTVKLTLRKTGDTQDYTFKDLCSVPADGLYELEIKVVPTWLKEDTVYVNNIRSKDLCTGIEGDYYIGFTSPYPNNTDTTRNFTTIQKAFDYVSQKCGVCDDINFYANPAASPYVERITIPKYLVNLDSPFVSLQPYGSTLNTAVEINQPTNPAGDQDKMHYAVRLNGSNFIRLKNLYIRNTSANFGSGVHFTKSASNNVIEGCKIEVNSTSINNVFYPIAFTSSNKLNVLDNNSLAKNGSSNRIVRNEIIGGYAGVGMLGASAVDFDKFNVIDSNDVKDFYFSGIYSNYNTIKSISFNKLTPRATSSANCVSISYTNGGAGGLINANKIINSKLAGIKATGIEAYTDDRLIISNNWITHAFGNSVADTSAALFIKRSNNVGVYYNSIRYNGYVSALSIHYDEFQVTTPEGTITEKIQPFNVDVYNNIIMIDSPNAPVPRIPYAVYFKSTDANSEFERNVYWSGYQSKFAYFPPLDQRSFAIWQQNTAKDLSSYYILPRFNSTLDLGYPANDTLQFNDLGLPVEGIDRDYTNRKRSPRKTDIGSLEYENETNDISLFKVVNERAVFGENEFSVMILNEGNANLSTTNICLEYSIDSGKTWIGKETVLLKDLKGRYDQQKHTFALKLQKNNFVEIPFCARIAPDCRLTGDTITKYESICKDLCVGLKKGDYTIGKNGTEDFANFDQAITALICGFDSSIVFNVSPGTYNERITLPILGTDFDKTVAFTSVTNNPKDVIIEYTNSGQETDHHVIKLAGTSHIVIRNLTIRSKATARASGVHLADSASYNLIQNCRFEFDSTRQVNTLVGVLGSGSIAYTEPALNFNNNVRDCYFNGGGFGVRFIGVKDAATRGPNQVINSTFRNQYTSAIDIFYSQIDSLSKNDIILRKGNTRSVGINIYGALTDFIITANKIHGAENSGFIMDSCRTISRGLIANNMIGGGNKPDGIGGDYGMYIKGTGAFPSKGVNSSGTIEILNNSVLYDGISDTAAAVCFQNSNSFAVFNNIFANYGNGYAIKYSSDPNNGITEFFDANSNLLYTKGSVLAMWKGVPCADINVLGQQDNSTAPFNVINSPGGIGSFDPMYRSNTDLHVNSTKLNAKGVPFIIVPTDIDGEARNPNTPDVGCDEFVPGFDISLVSFVTPVNNQEFKGSTKVIVQVKNLGDSLRNLKLKYTFDGVIIDSVTKIFTPALKYDSVAYISFAKEFSTRQGGEHKLTAYSEIKRLTPEGLSVNNDFDNDNDTLKITVISRDTSDLGVSYFLSPLNGLPLTQTTGVEVTVTNYGNLLGANYQLVLKVNDSIVETKTITDPITSKQSKNYSFNYLIDPNKAVFFNICSYTILYDDVLPENDSTCIVLSTLVSVAGNSDKGGLFAVFPNPTSSKVYYGVDLHNDTDVQISIYDLSGRLVSDKKIPNLLKGRQTIETYNDELTEGTYFFVLKTSDNTFNGRFVIVK